MRGYYRALKRKESWALKIERLNKASTRLQYFIALSYRYIDFATLIHAPNPLLALIPKGDFTGKYIPVPLKLGKD